MRQKLLGSASGDRSRFPTPIYGLVEIQDGTVMISLVGLGASTRNICIQVIGFQLDRLAEIQNGSAFVSLVAVGNSPRIKCPFVFRLQRNGFVEIQNGALLIIMLVLLYHESDLCIEEHYTDTAGFTDHVFAMMHLLGFRFAPRIRDLKDTKLYVPMVFI
jgi:Tn3 transposase DDE domain